jgi:GTP cyclohydrolase I
MVENKQMTAIRTGIRQLIATLGEDPDREGLRETPDRVIKAFQEQTVGYEIDIKSLFKVFDERYDEMIVLDNIEFNSLCEHHLLPFIGTATVGYIANGKIIGLSKMARLVDAFSRRLQVKERIGKQIADAIEENLKPQGVGVIIKAKHFCMSCRGVRKHNAVMVTSVLRGLIKSDEKARNEFIAFVKD